MDRLLRHALTASLVLHGAAMLAGGPTTPREMPRPLLEARLFPSTPAAEPQPVRPPPPAVPAQQTNRPVRHETPILTTTAPNPVATTAPPPPRDEAPPPPSPVATPPAPAAALELPRYDAAYLANPPPPYPLMARRRGIEGTVTVEARISPAGEPREVRLVAGADDESLDQAALEAVRHWRFIPARRGDQPVEAWVRIPLVFRLK